ncbi:hypothetical protein BP6252_10604 [Coleophoma cylindrospora]|uniref:Nucleolar 27S pre-rRNA processing Urb2/Npa2 C-terminal domain-containing protein n=1 Tax=Coleophoma cylindrospora TaxID=1849047 RepID=A0A3D8QT14_9HELO|nr:hypothetical protein BP6252_10604 [Coleophoma cylindrospora]
MSFFQAFKSRAAQEKLVQLEKDAAPFEDQLAEAARFIGVTLDELYSSNPGFSDGQKSTLSALHGREEWLLRWLLKKLQSPKDAIARKSASAWRIFRYVIQQIPLPSVARMLNERKFMTILQQTLDEILSMNNTTHTPIENVSDSSSTIQESPKTSKKRKRSGEVIVRGNEPTKNTRLDLLGAVYAAMDSLLYFTQDSLADADGIQINTLSAEYIRSVVRTSAEESAKILGSWLALSLSSLVNGQTTTILSQNWLSCGIKIWELHAPGDSTIQFALHTTRPLLSLLLSLKNTDSVCAVLVPELEKLVARNIILPAKSTISSSAVVVPKQNEEQSHEPDVLRDLTRASVLFKPEFATLLFDIAIRSLQPHNTRRRRSPDEAWLKKVFTTLIEPLPSDKTEVSTRALSKMIQSAIDHKVELDLPVLKSITATLKFSAPTEKADWELLATLIQLDANIFLIADEESNVLERVLTEITSASFKDSWLELQVHIVDKVLVPLMREFSKARDLTGFFRHWFHQLVECDTRRAEKQLPMSAWEDDALSRELKKLFESSLTVQQIIQTLDWLEEQSNDNLPITSVILQAIAGSITREEVADAIGLRIYHVVFDRFSKGSEPFRKMASRYRWRCWDIIPRSLEWANMASIGELEALWTVDSSPLTYLTKSGSRKNSDEFTIELQMLEQFAKFRSASTIWAVAEGFPQLQKLIKPIMLELLKGLTHDVTEFSKSSSSSTKSEYSVWAYIRRLVTDTPNVFGLYSELKTEFSSLISTIIRIISNAPQQATATEDIHTTWNLLLSQIVEELQDGENLLKNKYFVVAIPSLLQLPIEVFSRKQRQYIMSSWLEPDEKSSQADFKSLYPQLISLLVKILRRYPAYDGMKFAHLTNLATNLAVSATNQRVNLELLDVLSQLVLAHVISNIEQPPSRAYISDAVQYLQATLDSKSSKQTKYPSTKLIENLMRALKPKAQALSDLGIIDLADFESLLSKLQQSLQHQLKKQVRKEGTQVEESDALEILCVVGALDVIGPDASKLAKFTDDIKTYSFRQEKSQYEVSSRLQRFLASQAPPTHKYEDLESKIGGDITTVTGRKSVLDMASVLTKNATEVQKLALLQQLLGDDWKGLKRLDTTFAIKNLIASCEDTNTSREDANTASVNLSVVYAALCGEFMKNTSVRQFCLLAETMELMLRTKGHALTQWNIDSTLGSISILCSRHSPALNPRRASTIYLGLCSLLRAVLTSHRLKLQGHFHLVVQVMLALLRCLFTPLPHTNNTILKHYAAPSWLSASHPLTATHSTVYTRLLTQICDPSVSSVTRTSSHNALHSATEKARKMAGQHMQFVLTTYIKLQLEMRMAPQVREKMVPGLYALFDTTTPEMRRMLSEGLDSSGRAVFGSLFRDWQQFGKWKGS